MPQVSGVRPFNECDPADQLRVVGSNNITCLSVDAVERIWAWAIHVDWHCPGAHSCARLSRLLGVMEQSVEDGTGDTDVAKELSPFLDDWILSGWSGFRDA